MAVLKSLFAWARRLRRDALTLWFAWRHPQTPTWLKGLCAFVVAYALSPIDLIPDFIPLLGYVDDAILLPALIWLALRMLPAEILLTCRSQAQAWWERYLKKPRLLGGAFVILLLWMMVIWLVWLYWK